MRHKRPLLIYTLLSTPVYCAPVHAATGPISDVSAALRVFWGLLAVLGILLIIVAIAKKRVNFLQTTGKGVIQIIEVRHLMPKKALYLVSVRGQEYLLASGGDRLELIAPIDKKQTSSFDSFLESEELEEKQ